MSPFLDRSDRSCGGGVADPRIQVPGAYPATLPSPQGTGLLEVGGGAVPRVEGGAGCWGIWVAASSLLSLSFGVRGGTRQIKDVGSCQWGLDGVGGGRWEAGKCSGEGSQWGDTRLAVECGGVPVFSA